MELTLSRPVIEKIIQEASIEKLITYIEHAFTSYSLKSATVPPVGTLTFHKPPGEVHIKYGYIHNDLYYVIKIASGFYENPSLGISSSNGLNLVFNQKTGQLQTILVDEGFLTDIRTAIAGAIAAKYLAPETVSKIGIVGSGIQARLQLRYLKSIVNCRKVIVFGRDMDKKLLLSYKEEMSNDGFDIEITTDNRKLAHDCQLIVTTTPSKVPLIFSRDLQKGTHISAIGADTKGKQELDTAILEKANLIVVDSKKQCEAHGEIHKATQAGLLKGKKMVEIGEIISAGGIKRNNDDITVADLTGVATQDIQISKFVLENKNNTLTKF